MPATFCRESGRCLPYLPSILLTVLSLLPSCGGVATTDSNDGGIEAGTANDAGDNPDRGAGSDAGRPECDGSLVICKSVPPTCPKGEVPVVAGNCWAGHCVKATLCRTVLDCSVCTADNVVCAEDVGRLQRAARCVEVPSLCATDRTCKCLASSVCTSPSFSACGGPTPGGGFQCTCPTC